MKLLGSLFMIMVGFLAGIVFVYSCGGGGSSSSADVEELEARIAVLESTMSCAYMSTATINGVVGPHLIFSGVNIHVRNGSGQTDTVNGLGNLIVGYNESDGADPAHRTGSHNLVVGHDHEYTNYGGFVAGYYNKITGPSSSVSGGAGNTARDNFASVSGGRYNTASDVGASVSGGSNNTASGYYASVSGGADNTASGYYASIGGGYANTASGRYASISGGQENAAAGTSSSISGGLRNAAAGSYSSISGGYDNTASGKYSSITGGDNNEARGRTSSVNGGFWNEAIHNNSTVSGGYDLRTESSYDHVP